ncbi:PREDICTED: uncharacterized protein LOC106115846 [Papilio xuthus]|uniref:Uncharacterized protein LOC106115846 n=1 Tax=Papilio xuthus TaxID=66420 RepID=A0AAJ6Z3X1_PAPXU|nr:PREDICTED: uncharacterized protein LOC106115846 [Papilio xuthus]
MKKFKMPTVQEFLALKTIYGPKKEPVWVYLEREMRENVHIKPYNELVGAWLKFLRDLKRFQHREAQRKLKRLQREAGPGWFFELSRLQKNVLNDLKSNIHQDLIEDIPTRTRKSLSDLGVTLKIPKSMLMKAMTESIEDPGIFIWNLYTAYYKMPPSKLRGEYDINSMILMSSLVFIDLEECIERLEKLTESKVVEKKVKPKKPPRNFKPNVRYGDYLQKNYVPPYKKHAVDNKETKPPPLGNKVKLRSQSSYEKLCEDLKFLEKRKERNKKERPETRMCTYKFWEPPCTLRNSDPRLLSYLKKLRMLKIKAKPKFHSPYDNVQYNVGGVVFSGGRPHFILNNISLLPTGYVPINGGAVAFGKDVLLHIHGYWKFPKDVKEACEDECDCMDKWDTVLEYLYKSKCKCGHLYDYHNENTLTEKYFYQPTKHGPYWMDYAKIYQMDPTEDFIKDTFQQAIMSSQSSGEPKEPTILPSGLSEKELLAAFLAELSDTPLIIPHLPQANLLNNLQEWVRKRVKGKMSPALQKRLLLQSQRRWLDLKHIDFRARAYRIPFTLEQLNNMNWSHRLLIQKLFKILLNDFVTRNQIKQLEQTRLWWSTTKSDAYPSEAFIDVFFTYMPGRMKDIFLINPYSVENTKTHGAKTCPLIF